MPFRKRSVSVIFQIIIASAVLVAPVNSISGRQQRTDTSTISTDLRAGLDRISPDSLRGHLSFIASDSLEGRGTPSRGLDLAAEYIAAQFRRVGVLPAGTEEYFQVANWVQAERNAGEFSMTLKLGARELRVSSEQVAFSSTVALEATNAQLLKVDYRVSAELESLKPSVVSGAIIATRFISGSQQVSAAERNIRNSFFEKVNQLKPRLVVVLDNTLPQNQAISSTRLIDPENRPVAPGTDVIPRLTIRDPQVLAAYDLMKNDSSGALLSLNMPGLIERPVKLRNVIGKIEGSDPQLKDSVVIVSAHYDHIGIRPTGEGDRIFNGANDDGSGTVSLIEMASAITSLKQKPKRSIVFLAVFGEERGLLGSRYYLRHPIFPVEKTVAVLNLEQVGRTDSTEGPQVKTATLTGADYSDVGEVLRVAGQLTGIRYYKHQQNSDAFFSRSDNQAFADAGIPAHTLCVAFAFPDYHGVGDHWEKIDYQNLSSVLRSVMLGLFMLADGEKEPRWNEANPRTGRYVKAWRERRVQ